MTEDENSKIEDKEIERRTMKHGTCSCGRSGMLYKSLCPFCYVEKMREITEELQEMIREEGRSNLISTDKMKIIRDKLLEWV